MPSKLNKAGILRQLNPLFNLWPDLRTKPDRAGAQERPLYALVAHHFQIFYVLYVL